MIFKRSHLKLVGSTEYIDIAGLQNIPVKIDTGADSSSIWVSDIKMKKNGTLVFCFFGVESPYYNGEKIETSEYLARSVRSSHGDSQVRYLVELPVKIKGKEFVTAFTLANRERNDFPILIGKNTLEEGGFAVDVSTSAIKRHKLTANTRLNRELKKNPFSFHRKYIAKPARKGGAI